MENLKDSLIQLTNDRNKYCNYTDALFEYINLVILKMRKRELIILLI
jgi:hypothetical protein